MRSVDTNPTAPIPVSGGLTCPYTATRADRPGSGGRPADQAALTLLAAVETVVRLGREMPVRVRTEQTVLALDRWPDEFRRLPGDQAAAVVRTLAAAPDGDADGHLVVLLDLLDGTTPPPGTATVDPAVLVTCAVAADGVTATVHCPSTDPWSVAEAAVAETFAEVLAALLADPLLAPANAPALGPASRALALGEYAGRRYDDGPFRSIPAMIEEQADRHPHRPAISFQGSSLRYRQLNELANGFAATLAARGVRRGDVVPVLLADGLELPVTYLALMKLGAAFVPFDPSWPPERLRDLLRVVTPYPVLVTAAADPAPDLDRAVPVAVDDIEPTSARPGVPVGPDDLIYGIFTSGTTGTPKCAMNRHAGLTNRFRFMTRWFRATGDEVVLQNSRHTFDSSVWQLFWPLTTGGRVVVPAHGGFLDIEQVIRTIAAERVTVTDFVPSIFGVLVAMVDRDARTRQAVGSLRHLIVGGEEIVPAMVHRLRELLPEVTVTNGYGPTEASIGMVFHPVTPADGDAVPIGRPIDNCYAVVVDANLSPLPPGATGEIVIGGVCLGDGYLGAPGRTAESFVPNPLPEIPGRRLYRTGDLGRLGADGQIYFVGRRDLQVKINGVRIEPGEIESAAARFPQAREAKVLLARTAGRRSLALFVATDQPVDETALREHLRRLLPRTNLPRHIIVLAALPLTENGKVDRRALQAHLDGVLAERSARLTAAAGSRSLPDRVLAVFRTVLDDPELAADRDFLAAGGDSLQAVSIATALTDEHGVPVGVQDLFEQPTPARMTRFLTRRIASDAPVEAEADLVERDTRLPADLVVRAVDGSREPRTVLVTGATGFVGSRLVHELLTATDLRVRCLTRAADDATATERVRRALADRGLWRPGFTDRLTGYAADLSRPGLGLDRPTWDHLAGDCDLVLHNAALVNFLFDYRTHRPANVTGTTEVLRLAMAGRPKALHHISTLGVLDSEAVRWREPLPEHVDPAHAVVPTSGYSRSKWVAERQLTAARRRGATITVFRLGEVMPAADNGQPNEQALTHLLLAACHRLGMRPAAPIRSDWTPVDYVARRVVAGIVDRTVWGRTLHVHHPRSVDFTELPATAGPSLPRVSCAQFLAGLRAAATDADDRAAAALLAIFPPQFSTDEAHLRELFSGLLTDNPRLFRRDECHRLEQDRGFTDDDLTAPIRAYRSWLARPEQPQPDRLLLPTGPG